MGSYDSFFRAYTDTKRGPRVGHGIGAKRERPLDWIGSLCLPPGDSVCRASNPAQ